MWSTLHKPELSIKAHYRASSTCTVISLEKGEAVTLARKTPQPDGTKRLSS